MSDSFSRTELLLGKDAMLRLKDAFVAVFGIGGVGSFAAEALARSGVGRISLFDSDKISITNLNRQLIATTKTIGRLKIDVMRERILEINPKAYVETRQIFYLPENADEVDLSGYTYIIDAVDTVAAKLELIVRAKKANIRIISSMGAGNKLDPTLFEVADIKETSVCPLAKTMRRELKKRGVEELKVVYSKESPIIPHENLGFTAETACTDGINRDNLPGRRVPGSVSFVPPVAGLILAGEVIKDIAEDKD